MLYRDGIGKGQTILHIEILSPACVSYVNSKQASCSGRHSACWSLGLWRTYISSVLEVSLSPQALPSENCTTAHFPLQAHLRAPLSPPPPGRALMRSSSPLGRPTTTSALQVRSARTRMPDAGPIGPMASVKGVVAGHDACGNQST